MKITYYGYNTFIIEDGDRRIAIDPGAKFLYRLRMPTLIPKSEWSTISHVIVTHGDPDHYWYCDKILQASEAKLICSDKMVKEINGEQFMLSPRGKGLKFNWQFDDVVTLSEDKQIEIDGMKITGIKITHGPLHIKIGPFRKIISHENDERIGRGSLGFKIEMGGKTIVNLGDTLYHKDEWKQLKDADLLMIPIGGHETKNTMDELEAAEAVKNLQPKIVIPTHYNLQALFFEKLSPADVELFKKEIEGSNAECRNLKLGEAISLN